MPRAGRPAPEERRVTARVAVVAARFNAQVTDKLLAGAVKALQDAGAVHETFRVPGSFELPAAARRLARTRRYDAIVPLGCLLRGETPHFEFIAAAVAHGLMRLSLEEDVPVVFGVLTCDTLAQALDRAGGAEGNKGAEAAEAALEILALVRAQREAARPAQGSDAPAGRRPPRTLQKDEAGALGLGGKALAPGRSSHQKASASRPRRS